MTSMALDFFGSNRGRRKQAKPQRKNVDEEAKPNERQPRDYEKDEEPPKMTDAAMCNQSNPDSNHNGIMQNSDKRNIERKKETREDGGGDEEDGKMLNDGYGSREHEVPNGSRAAPRHIQGPQNLETVLRVNGVVKKEKPSVISDTCKRETNLGLQHLLLLENPKTNGDCSPSLKEPKTPVIVVKTVSDLNSSDFSAKQEEKKEATEEERIQEYLRRSDTAVIYQEPVGQANVPLSPAAVKALAEADINSQEYFIKCLHCQKAYPGLQALRDHIETDHPRSLSPNEALSPVQGSYSPAPVPVQGGLHHCAQCSVTFSTKDQLEKHELLHSPNAQVSCKVCNKQFANVYRLQRHMISHDESAVLRKFKCPECEKAFKFKHHLKEHIRIHSGEKPFECANCGKRFSHSGSYSSHMTSKKCLVMNLKVNRGRGGIGIDKAQMNRNIGGGAKRNVNNNVSSLKGNLNLGSNMAANPPFPSILPKYSDTAAAFLSAVAPRSTFASPSAPGLHPFYMATPPTMHAYNIPALNHFLEQFATPSGMLMNTRKERDDYKDEKSEEASKESTAKEEPNSKQEPEEVKSEPIREEKSEDEKEPKDRSSPVSNSGGDLEAVKRILETVNATVTKQFLQANMQKFTSSPSGSSCASAPSPGLEEKPKKGESIECKHCGKVFQSRIDHHQHERYLCETLQKSEGLAAKLEDVATVKREESVCSGSEDEDAKEGEEEIERNEDGGITITTTTQESGADGRKVRVRSLIADEQLAILKHHYLMNPRPKREELAKIADKIGFPVRVVQVWFQNTRARDRREGRLVQVPYLPLPALFPNNVPLLHSTLPEQPLDLSTKKSQDSSPESSPPRSSNDSDVINLSRKSSSPSPPQIFPNGLTIRAMPNLPQFQHSSCPSSTLADFRRTPSPLAYLNLHQEDLKNNGSRLARILTQPPSLTQRLDANGVTLVPMEKIVFNQELQNSASPLPMMALSLLQENGRACSSSPGSDKRPWVEGDLTDETEDSRPRDADQGEFAFRVKQQKVSMTVVDPQSDQELEGQFICDQCEKAFSKQSSLARHKYEHSGQRPHKCEVCEKAFKHKHHLTEHKRLHSGEKPFQCGKCLKRFSHSGSYSQHMNHRYSYCKPYRD